MPYKGSAVPVAYQQRWVLTVKNTLEHLLIAKNPSDYHKSTEFRKFKKPGCESQLVYIIG